MRKLLALAALLIAPQLYAQASFDTAINHGRVIDPASGLDAVRHLGIRDGRIEQVSEQPLSADHSIDASGLVVAPGFIDLHTHSPTELGQYYQLFDGVTTALELEAGAFPSNDYAGQIADQALINYGASSGYISLRLRQMNGIELADPTAMPWPVNWTGVKTFWNMITGDITSAMERTFRGRASAEDVAAMQAVLAEDIRGGGLGIGLALDYISEAVGDAELRAIFEVAGDAQVPVFVHVRRGINGDPAGLREVLALAEETGAGLHICHLTHSAMRNTELFLAEIRAARERGVDVTTELLPYNAGSAPISSAVFSRDWQTIFDITYEDVEWAATGERFTEQTWEQRRAEEPSGVVIHHYLKDEWTRIALADPDVIVVSDLLAMETKDKLVAPHNGSFTRVLGHYARDEGLMSLPEALGKMTYLPAKRLEGIAPAFARKGRLQAGMDADIVVFDAQAIKDNATYQNPYQEASGIAHVLVGGEQVVRDGALVPGTYPGRRLTRNTP